MVLRVGTLRDWSTVTHQDEHSTPAETPLVFLHPIGLDHRVWHDVAPPGGVCLDFPGFGSAPATASVSLAALVDYVVGQVPAPATFVGLSLGGMVAQQIAVRRPDAVTSLVVVCSRPSASPESLRERARLTRSRGMAGTLASTLERWFSPGALASPGHAGVAYARQRWLADDPEVVARYWEAMGGHDVRQALGRATVPITYIAGTLDRANSPGTLSRAAAAAADGAVEVIEGPHMLPLEQPKAVRAALDRHLSRLEEGIPFS